MSIACCIIRYFYGIHIESYFTTSNKSVDSWPKDKNVHQIIDALKTVYGDHVGKIVIANDPELKPDQLEKLRTEDFKEHGNLVEVAAERELDFEYYLTERVVYSNLEYVVLFEKNRRIALYRCTEASEKKVTFNKKDVRQYGFEKYIDFEHATRMFGLILHKIHAVFEEYEVEIK